MNRLLPLAAIIVVALLGACSTISRPAADIPSSVRVPGPETAQPRTGASSSTVAVPTAPVSSAVVTTPPVATAATIPIAEGRNPNPPEDHLWQATWYADGPGLYAAIRPNLGRKGQLVVVCGGKPWTCLTLPIVTTCLCLGPDSNRAVDLSPAAFQAFAPLSRGVTLVSVEVLQ